MRFSRRPILFATLHFHLCHIRTFKQSLLCVPSTHRYASESHRHLLHGQFPKYQYAALLPCFSADEINLLPPDFLRQKLFHPWLSYISQIMFKCSPTSHDFHKLDLLPGLLTSLCKALPPFITAVNTLP